MLGKYYVKDNRLYVVIDEYMLPEFIYPNDPYESPYVDPEAPVSDQYVLLMDLKTKRKVTTRLVTLEEEFTPIDTKLARLLFGETRDDFDD